MEFGKELVGVGVGVDEERGEVDGECLLVEDLLVLVLEVVGVLGLGDVEEGLVRVIVERFEDVVEVAVELVGPPLEGEGHSREGGLDAELVAS